MAVTQSAACGILRAVIRGTDGEVLVSWHQQILVKDPPSGPFAAQEVLQKLGPKEGVIVDPL